MAQAITREYKDISLTFNKNPITNDLIVVKNATSIARSVRNLILTIVGERFFQPDLGSRINNSLFELLDFASAAEIQSEIELTIKNIRANYQAIRELGVVPQILVIDDGSSDNTAKRAERAGADKVIRNKKNMKLGATVWRSLVFGRNAGFDLLVKIDADLQHDPKYINDFIKIDDDVDIVIGARSFNGDMPFLRRFSNSITSFIVSKLIGKRVYDSQSGYRRYRLSSIPFDQCLENGFQFESEILINTLRQKHSTLDHIAISTLYNDEKSSINNALDTYKFIKLIVRKIIAR